MMKKCYEDKDLQVSKDPFERPDNLSIKVDCYTPRVVVDTTMVPIEEEQNPEEFGL